jgi:hypothetical protein
MEAGPPNWTGFFLRTERPQDAGNAGLSLDVYHPSHTCAHYLSAVSRGEVEDNRGREGVVSILQPDRLRTAADFGIAGRTDLLDQT